ncbi:MAG: hypothetical protein IJP45_09115 [Paludibacteraceae bacterium]|nr:hypothetical protein [Paludibacteraceae bacterium]
MNQNEKILVWMKRNGSITPWEALEYIGCMRLSARIADLKALGHNIGSEQVKHANRHYSRYFIKEG